MDNVYLSHKFSDFNFPFVLKPFWRCSLSMCCFHRGCCCAVPSSKAAPGSSLCFSVGFTLQICIHSFQCPLLFYIRGHAANSNLMDGLKNIADTNYTTFNEKKLYKRLSEGSFPMDTVTYSTRRKTAFQWLFSVCEMLVLASWASWNGCLSHLESSLNFYSRRPDIQRMIGSLHCSALVLAQFAGLKKI